MINHQNTGPLKALMVMYNFKIPGTEKSLFAYIHDIEREGD